MNQQRVNLLRQFISDDPLDPFPRYALALELADQEPNEVAAIFKHLLAAHPDYLPVYYHAAQFYMKRGDTDLAREVIQKGIEKTKAAADWKTASELQTLESELD